VCVEALTVYSKTELLVFGTANNLKMIRPGSEVMQAEVGCSLIESADVARDFRSSVAGRPAAC